MVIGNRDRPFGARFVDSHCHLERQTYGEELPAVIARARAAGVDRMIAIGASGGVAGAREAVALAVAHADIFAVVGLHPHESAKVGDADLAALAELCAAAKVVGLGEIGLDYHYDFAPREVQRAWFARELALARERNLPVVLHTREAHADTLAILDQGLPAAGGVVHCFTGTAAEARDFLARGLFLSIPGVVTFRNAEPLRAAVREIPLDRLLIETDAPYLAPIPHRGKRNEPAYVVETARAIAALVGLHAEDVGRITARNAERLFRLPASSSPALAYLLRDGLYLNLTNRCTLACTFCPKVERHDYWLKGHDLRLHGDPPLTELEAALAHELGRRADVREIVFVGLGEPTLRLTELCALAGGVRATHGQRYRLRLDTDGLANLVHGRDVTPELARVLDAVSVSLNAADGETYARLCPSRYGAAAWAAVKGFIAAAKRAGLAVTASAVTVPGLDIDAVRRVAEEELGVTFRARIYQQLG